MTGRELYDLFVDDGITFEEVAMTHFGDLIRYITGKRRKEPDDIGLSDTEIAMRIQEYATNEAGI